MASVIYPGLPTPVDIRGIFAAADSGYKAGQDWRDRKEAPEVYGQYISKLRQAQGTPQTLASLAPTAQPSNTVTSASLPPVSDPATARVESAFAAQGAMPSVGEMRQYIAQAAKARNIDPGTAIRVANSEGLQPNTWQSNVMKGDLREPSFGPFQMLVGGGDTGFPTGLGNAFNEQTGLDASDPKNWKQAVDFALDTASKQGWGQWNGAKAAGIQPMQGINGGGAVAPSQQALESLGVGQSMPMGQGQPAQVADASGGFMPQGAMPSLPDTETMKALFANPLTRPIAIEAARKRRDAIQDQNDPTKRLAYEKALLEVQNLRNPRAKPTDDMREYELARQQGYQGTFQNYLLDMKRAGATSVNVNSGDNAWNKENAKLFAKRYDDISRQAGNAQDMLSMYDLAEQALTSGVRTGFGAETELNLRQLGAAMGIDTDPEKLAGGELIRSIQNRMALLMRSPSGGMGMPGALSDRDIKFLKDAQIGLDRSPVGNRRMLEAYRAMEQRKIEISQLADQYVQDHGKLDAGFNKAVREYAKANPIFPENPQGSGAVRGPGGATGRQRARNPQTGEIVEWDGTQWRPVQ